MPELTVCSANILARPVPNLRNTRLHVMRSSIGINKKLVINIRVGISIIKRLPLSYQSEDYHIRTAYKPAVWHDTSSSRSLLANESSSSRGLCTTPSFVSEPPNIFAVCTLPGALTDLRKGCEACLVVVLAYRIALTGFRAISIMPFALYR